MLQPAPILSTVPSTIDATSSSPVRAHNVTVSYDGRPVLRSVSFDLPPASLTGVIGPNGAGKSTLLKALLGLIPLDAGHIEIFGKSIESNRNRVAYVPQKQTVDWDFPVTAFDVVLMGRYGRGGRFRRLFGRPSPEDRSRAHEALEQVAMTRYSDRHIRQLSGGQQQRVFLARALCQGADVLLLDEPLGGVDAATEETLFDLMEHLNGLGKTLLMVNHDLSVLDRFSMVLLLNQRVVAFGPTAETATDANLRRTYGGRLSLLDRAETALHDMK